MLNKYKVQDFINYMESIASPKLTESWDNTGFMIGDRNKNVSNIIITMDLTFEVLKMAEDLEDTLVIAHHPLIYFPMKNVTTDSFIGRKVLACVKQDINLYVAHTNFDLCKYGTSDALYDMLELKDKQVILPFENSDDTGLGRLGVLDVEITFGKFLEKLKSLNFNNTRYFLGENTFEKKVKTIAIVAGSFDEPSLRKAKELGADLLLSGDLKYHDAQICYGIDLPYVDIGHYDSEMPSLYKLKEMLKQQFQANILICDKNEVEIKNY